MKILAIETSCDETAAAVIETEGKLPGNRRDFAVPAINILSDVVASQISVHRPFGGVVPNLAKREHQRNLMPVVEKALKEAGLLKKNQKQTQNIKNKTLNEILKREEILRPKLLRFLDKYRKPEIDLIAVTRGPGLAPALWPGVNLARSLSYFWRKPLVGINHLEGHIAANWLPPIGGISNLQFPIYKHLFPVVCLVVSGGHTQLILMRNFGKYRLIGETRDDAAGECFDKVARILGLGYPGGPAIAQIAAQWKSKIQNPKSKINSKFEIKNSKLNITLPRPMINSKDYDFSFSGLKTAVLYLVKEIEKSRKIGDAIRAKIAADTQQAIIDVLVAKTLRAAKNYRARTVMLSGGVTANRELRRQMKKAVEKQIPNTKYRIPNTKFCTDNAAMIAVAGLFHSKKGKSSWRKMEADANLRLA